METELAQTSVLYLTKAEADRLLAKLQNSAYLRTYGVEVYTVKAEPMTMNDGSKHEAVTVMVRAETDMQCGMGHGFVTMVSEGLVK